MAEAARDLWPEDIDVEGVVPPVVILRKQASLLTDKTKGLVRGEVESEEKPLDSVEEYLADALKPDYRIEYTHNLVLTVPALQGYRYVLLSVIHDFQPYPCRVIFHPAQAGDLGRERGVPDEGTFVLWLREAFARRETKRVVQALLRQAQET
jgi:hypothetical protein